MKILFNVRVEYEFVFMSVEIEVQYHIEINHGSDSDGNRGMDLLCIDEIEILRVDKDRFDASYKWYSNQNFILAVEAQVNEDIGRHVCSS